MCGAIVIKSGMTMKLGPQYNQNNCVLNIIKTILIILLGLSAYPGGHHRTPANFRNTRSSQLCFVAIHRLDDKNGLLFGDIETATS